MENVVDFIQKNNSKIQGGCSTIVSMGLDKAGAKSFGSLVAPAVWATNYAVNGATPDKVDVGLYLTGLLSSTAAVPATIVGLFKSSVDDRTNQQVMAARTGEDTKYRQFILPCAGYAMSPPAINAMTIASKGGSAWLHPNGVWLFIVDARGAYVHDFKPKNFVKLYRPKSVAQKGANGRYAVKIVKKGSGW